MRLNMPPINQAYRKLSHNLVGLCAFNLVAQHGNFTAAADALGLTQSAMSQRIKSLELELGVILFKRVHRGVTLTDEGLRLHHVVRPAMMQIGDSITFLLERKTKPRVRLSADFAFSTFWLLPRLSHLRSELGDEIEVQILASQAPPEVNNDDCDITIHVRPISAIAKGDVLLLEESVAAVCSSEFLDKHGPLKSSADLLDVQLISLSKPPSAEWQTWQGWFNGLGIVGKPAHGFISFNNYDMVTQSAIAGHGVALGWLGLVDEAIENGLLVQATGDVVTSQAGYVMSRDYSRASRGPARVFDWIANCAAERG
ncbi:MAG: LysR family transcriptional regulator [Pseudomonadota bacterium]